MIESIRDSGRTDLQAFADAQLCEALNQQLKTLSTREDHYLALVGDSDWPADKLAKKCNISEFEREKS